MAVGPHSFDGIQLFLLPWTSVQLGIRYCRLYNHNVMVFTKLVFISFSFNNPTSKHFSSKRVLNFDILCSNSLDLSHAL